jgi:DHA1 family bicyclomycin/chloramphenicol resistance-like MFS transporter
MTNNAPGQAVRPMPHMPIPERDGLDPDAGDGSRPGDGGAHSRQRRPSLMLPLPLTLIILGLTYWCVDIASPTLPVIQADLGLSGAGAGLVMSVFFFGRLLSNFPAAFLIERIGPRGCALGGSLVLALGSAGAALAPGELTLLVMRGLQGAGVALLATAGLLSLLRAWPGGGAAMTGFNISAGIGGGLGLISGGFVTAEYGWRGVFWLCCGLALAMLVGTLIVHTVQGRRRSGASAPLAPEARPATLVVSRGLVAGIAASLLVYINYGVWVVALALFATERFGTDPGELGTMLLVVNIVHLTAAMPVGRAIRRSGAPVALAIGYGLAPPA